MASKKKAASAGAKAPAAATTETSATAPNDTSAAASAAPPPAPKPSKRDGEPREFKVVSLLKHDGETYEPGDGVDLTRTQFDALKGTGAIEGDSAD